MIKVELKTRLITNFIFIHIRSILLWNLFFQVIYRIMLMNAHKRITKSICTLSQHSHINNKIHSTYIRSNNSAIFSTSSHFLFNRPQKTRVKNHSTRIPQAVQRNKSWITNRSMTPEKPVKSLNGNRSTSSWLNKLRLAFPLISQRSRPPPPSPRSRLKAARG